MKESTNPIRIEIPEETIRILKIDKTRFGTSSMNELYNKIINNYVDESPVNMRNLVLLKNSLVEEIKDITESQLRAIIDIVARNSIKDLRVDDPGRMVSISIKPTSISEEGFNTLYQICNVDHFSSMTKAIRNLLISYTKLAVIEREKIILKHDIQKLQYAIRNHLRVSITHKNKDYIVSPYILITPVDDFSNYLIAKTEDHEYKLFRVINIKINKVIEYSMFEITKREKETLNKYAQDGITIFDSEILNIFKKALNQDQIDEVFPNVINQLRGLTGNEHQIKAK
ncbi:MAG: hypothetical protein C4537_00415 [Acholeplasma sp.]|jgi:hypothetical protein|nr:MAG: hypothetical protein C4537_00415 [Acholeplasma sp.]